MLITIAQLMQSATHDNDTYREMLRWHAAILDETEMHTQLEVLNACKLTGESIELQVDCISRGNDRGFIYHGWLDSPRITLVEGNSTIDLERFDEIVRTGEAVKLQVVIGPSTVLVLEANLCCPINYANLRPNLLRKMLDYLANFELVICKNPDFGSDQSPKPVAWFLQLHEDKHIIGIMPRNSVLRITPVINGSEFVLLYRLSNHEIHGELYAMKVNPKKFGLDCVDLIKHMQQTPKCFTYNMYKCT